MIEYAELVIGGEVIQRVPSDFLAIYSDNYVTQTKQHNLAKLVGKPPLEFSGTPVSDNIYFGIPRVRNLRYKIFCRYTVLLL
jgi:hypothetical protein